MLPHESRRKSLRHAYLKTGVCGLVCLAVILLMAGCNVSQSSRMSDKFWAGVRPASGDTERLMRNFRYLKAAGRTELALRELEEAHYQDPDNLKIIDILAQCYEELGAWKRAEKLYLSALARDRDNPALANNLCFSYYQAGKFDKAEACFRDLLKRQPQDATVRNNLGLLLVKTGRQEEAFRMWREHENDATAKTRLNQALAALGMTPQLDVARQANVRGNNKESAAAPTPPAISKPPVAGKSPVQTAAAPPVSAVPAEQPGQSGAQVAPRAAEVVQASAPMTSPRPAATAPETKSVKPEPVTRLVLSTQQTASKAPTLKTKISAPIAAPAPAPGEPAVIPASSPRPQRAAAVAAGQSAPAGAPSLAKTELAAAPAAVAPKKIHGKAATREAATPAHDASPLEPERPKFLSVEELVNTRLDIRNGNGLQGFAALNSAWLTMEGFHVAAIGNHIDFGKKKTEISYKPQAERVAQVLKEDFFPEADLKASDGLGKDADVRITLGHDQKARKAKIDERMALLDLRAQLAVILASARKSEEAAAVAASTKGAEAQTTQASKTVLAKPPARISASEPVNTQAVILTAEELTKTRIELRNGNGVQDQARKLRSEMEVQGFNVVRIKNHIDFGMAQTKILHRNRAQRVAQALNQKYFRSARLEKTANLPENVDVKIILGKDLSGGLDLMAKLAD